MSAVFIQDEIIHYEVLGRGRPIFFLHGWAGSWRYWIPSMQAVSPSFRAYALDLWGFGDTAKKPAYYRLDEQVDLLEQFLQHMGIGKIALVGHGLGGVVSMLFASLYPEHIDRLMAIALPFDPARITPRLSALPPADIVDWLMPNTPEHPSTRQEAAKADHQSVLRSLEDLKAIRLENLLARLKIPALMIYGQEDAVIGEPPSELLDALPENAHYLVFEQAGHFPMLDQPSVFHRLLLDLLSLKSGESPRALQLKEEWKRRVR